jgi:hypothetical protein
MPKVNVWCSIMKDCITGPSFFLGATVTSHSYPNMLEHYVAQQLPTDVWLQQHGALPHFGHSVHEFLDECFLNKWTG